MSTLRHRIELAIIGRTAPRAADAVMAVLAEEFTACTVCRCATCGGVIERSGPEASDWRHVGQRTWDHGAVPVEHR